MDTNEKEEAPEGAATPPGTEPGEEGASQGPELEAGPIEDAPGGADEPPGVQEVAEPEGPEGEGDDPDDEEEDEEIVPAEIDESDDTAAGQDKDDRLAAQARLLSDARVQTICESLLFVSDKPLNERQIQQVTGIAPARTRAAMEALQGHYREGVSGVVLHEVAGGWQFRTCPTSARFVRRFLKVKPQRLTRAALETLSIVAYRQPVTRPEVEEIRGVDCGAVMKALLERGLVQVIGKKEEVGRPLLYGTTRGFLEFFNLKDLSSLPTLREFHELNEEHRQIVEDTYPGAEGAADDGGILDGLDDADLQESRADDEEALTALDEAVQAVDATSSNVRDALDGKRPSKAVEEEAGAEAPASDEEQSDA